MGTGQFIEVWKDAWIPDNPRGRLVARTNTGIHEHMMVAELIEDKQWKLDSIADAISGEDAKNIQSIPLSASHRKDKIVWRDNKDDEYTVKTAYRTRRCKMQQTDPNKASFSDITDGRGWKKVWKLKIMPRIKHFIWRIMNKAVATNEALFRRKCAPNHFCPVCETEVETIEHALMLCPWAKFAWFSCKLGVIINEFNVRKIEKWIEEGLLSSKEHNDEIQTYVATHLWNIWKTRCRWVFERVHPCPTQVVMITDRMMAEQVTMSCIPPVPNLAKDHRRQVRWTKPPMAM